MRKQGQPYLGKVPSSGEFLTCKAPGASEIDESGDGERQSEAKVGDPLEGEAFTKAFRFLQLAMNCCQSARESRPSMYRVASAIESLLETQQVHRSEVGGPGVPFPEFERPEFEKELTATETLRLADSTLTQHLERNQPSPSHT